MRVVAIIQARLTSTRFPKKVLEKINGETIISRVCKAARESQFIDKVVVAWAHHFPQFNENDVLARYQELAKREHADVVVRLTSDCPLLNEYIISQAVYQFQRNQEPYYCNRDKLRDGFDVQVATVATLFEPSMTDKEHVFSLDINKLSVDTPLDLERVRFYAK